MYHSSREVMWSRIPPHLSEKQKRRPMWRSGEIGNVGGIFDTRFSVSTSTPDRSIERIQFQAKQVGLYGTIHKTLDKHSYLCLFINRLRHDTTHEVSCVLGVSVQVTLILLQIQDLSSSPEFGTRRFKQRGYLSPRHIKFILHELGYRCMLLVYFKTEQHCTDGKDTHDRTHSFDCRPFDIAQMGKVVTCYVTNGIVIIQHA
uniref:Uncharacterized protein n=1 Tax=Hyaloperonospora arabidopsidis (strain Emoy2) TaxID=559515 RepID=M4C4R4_HYAAE